MGKSKFKYSILLFKLFELLYQLFKNTTNNQQTKCIKTIKHNHPSLYISVNKKAKFEYKQDNQSKVFKVTLFHEIF